jgi:hypothetical protein
MIFNGFEKRLNLKLRWWNSLLRIGLRTLLYSTTTTTGINYPLLCIVESNVTIPYWTQEAVNHFKHVNYHFDENSDKTEMAIQETIIYWTT